MDNAYSIQQATKGIGKNQRFILGALYSSPQPLKKFISVQNVVVNLQNRGLVELKDDQAFLTVLGQTVCASWQAQANEDFEFPSMSSDQEIIELPKAARLSPATLEKSNQCLALYKQGLTYRAIGEKYEISRERVRQILNKNPAFSECRKEREALDTASEIERKEREKHALYLKSLAGMYPERVAELWDYEKNGDLKPENTSAGSTQHEIWFKCRVDGHSWKKKPNDITTSWTRSGTSGCPACAGKKKKPEKQPSLIIVYSELVNQYWDYRTHLTSLRSLN
jgi:Probable Zinc-ribbon domain/Sigma-70, region 4